MDTGPVTLTAAVQVAGLVQVAVALANLVAARIYRYREAAAALPTFLRNVFFVQNGFIVLTVAAFGGLSMAYADELTSGTGLGRAFSAFLAAFWGLRLLVQLVYYDRTTRREHRAFEIVALCAFAYLTVVFTVAALG